MTKWGGSKPIKCDICKEPFTTTFIDANTRTGQWCKLCPLCHKVIGVGLGTGRGQLYDLKTLEKLEG